MIKRNNDFLKLAEKDPRFRNADMSMVENHNEELFWELRKERMKELDV